MSKMSHFKIYFPTYSGGKRLIMEIAEWTPEGRLVLSSLGKENFVQVNSPEDADWILIPIFLSGLVNEAGYSYLKEVSELSKKHKKPLGLFSNSDLIVDPRVSNYHLFTPGAYSTDKRLIELPALLPIDPVSKYFEGNLAPLGKKEKPTLGFCGQATANGFKTAKDLFLLLRLKFSKRIGKSPYLTIPMFLPAYERYRLLENLEKSSKIKTDFVYRMKYRAGAHTAEDKLKVEREFYQNIRDNMFTLCLRGMGNYSVRFYQTLAMGRIPVLVDTESKVPFEEYIPEKGFYLRVPYKERNRIDQFLEDFIEKKSEEELIQLQLTCRKVWESYYRKGALLQLLYSEMKGIYEKCVFQE